MTPPSDRPVRLRPDDLRPGNRAVLRDRDGRAVGVVRLLAKKNGLWDVTPDGCPGGVIPGRRIEAGDRIFSGGCGGARRR